MKIKEGFILREVAGSYLVVAVGKAVKDFKGVINLNETGAFLWKQLEKGADFEQLKSALLNEYSIEDDNVEQVENDIKLFLQKLEENKLID